MTDKTQIAPTTQRTPSNRKFLRDAIIALVILSPIAVGWFALARNELDRLTPPPGVTTLHQFAAVMPSPRRLSTAEGDGTRKIVWIGEIGHWLLPSGPACYVFDSRGKHLDWAWETGEGGPIDRFYAEACEHDSLTIDQALASIDQPTSQK